MGTRDSRESYNAYQRVYHLRRYHERMAEAKRVLGGKCVICGTDQKLEIDHVDPKKKSFTVSIFWACAKKKFFRELQKCQLLCKTHHLEKTLRDAGKLPAKGTHGTLSSYRYCKCAECRAAKSRSNKLQKKRRDSSAGRATDL